MRDHDGGALLHQCGERRGDQRLAFGIKRRSRLVEQKERRVAQDGARNGDALPLAAGERDSALADRRVEALRQRGDERGGVAHARRRGRISASEASGRPKRILSAIVKSANITLSCGTSAMRARSAAGSRSWKPNAVERDASGGRVVIAQQQMEDRAFAGAGRADDGELLAVPHMQTSHAVERRDVGAPASDRRNARRRTRLRRAAADGSASGCAGAAIAGLIARISNSRSAAPEACATSPPISESEPSAPPASTA